MPRIRLSTRFSKSYAGLPEQIRKKVDRQILRLGENITHPSLQSKPIQGIEGVFDARVDQNYRMTYERLPGDILLLRVVGKHDEALKNP
jgi:mRNA-degrading endonuclease RelE of RelBE toxin-antitoxin system